MPLNPTMLRTSERSQFKRCRQAWWWAFVEDIKPKTAAPALRFGSLIHKAMELRYPVGKKRGPHPAPIFTDLYEKELEQAAKFGFKDEDDKWHEAGELGVAMLNSFVEQYGDDEEWEVLASELPFQVPIGHGMQYVGILDGVWRNIKTKEIWIQDWKTAKSISTNHLVLDEQAGSYWAYAPDFLRKQGLLTAKQELRGILYTFMRKALPDDRPKSKSGLYLNKDGSTSMKQPPPYFQRVETRRNESTSATLRARVQAEVREMRLVREGKLGVIKTPGPMTCGGCGFRDLCELHEMGADYESFKSQTMAHWEPYDVHAVADGR